MFVAEVKTVSPFGWKSSRSWDELFVIANDHGDMLSIHTDSRWGGSFELINKARRRTKKPILAKGIHVTDAEVELALAAGADYVLVVGRIPALHQNKCWIEVNDLEQLQHLPPHTKAVWNDRNLANGRAKTSNYSDARQVWNGWLAQASFVSTPADVHPSADAYIVGTNLVEFIAARKNA